LRKFDAGRCISEVDLILDGRRNQIGAMQALIDRQADSMAPQHACCDRYGGVGILR
jgi:hypothetical protein